MNKGTGVHDQHVGLTGVRHRRMPSLDEKPDHHLGIDLILGAAKREQKDLHRLTGEKEIAGHGIWPDEEAV